MSLAKCVLVEDDSGFILSSWWWQRTIISTASIFRALNAMLGTVVYACRLKRATTGTCPTPKNRLGLWRSRRSLSVILSSLETEKSGFQNRGFVSDPIITHSHGYDR